MQKDLEGIMPSACSFLPVSFRQIPMVRPQKCEKGSDTVGEPSGDYFNDQKLPCWSVRSKPQGGTIIVLIGFANSIGSLVWGLGEKANRYELAKLYATPFVCCAAVDY